jgi:phosphotransferase system enzyme I (PtsI)
MAGDVLLTPLLLGLGVDELSATSAIVPRVKKAVQSLDASRCESLVQAALAMEDSAAIQQMSLEMARECYADITD